jgi:hypothetical protein
MEDHRLEESPQALARLGGVLYLIIIALGTMGELYIRGRIVVPGDAAATAANIRAQEGLWRWGIAAEAILLSSAIAVALILLILLRPVSRDLAWLAVFFNLPAIIVEAVGAVFLVGAMLPTGSAAYLQTLPPEHLHAMSSLSLRMHGHAFAITLVFFAFVCLIWGYLIYRSGYLPRVIGVLMMIAGVCYLVNSFVFILAPGLSRVVFPAILMPVFVAETSLALWLLIKGVNLEKWQHRLGQRAA